MKRLALILLTATLFLSPTLAAKVITTDELFKEFASAPKVESVNINSFLMWLAKLSVGNDPDAEVVKKISSVRVLDLESCPKDVKTRFANRASQVTVNDMEDLVNVNKDGNKVKILAKIKKEKIHKLLVMCYGKSDCCLVEINGKFDMNDLDGVVKSQMPRHNDR